MDRDQLIADLETYRLEMVCSYDAAYHIDQAIIALKKESDDDEE